MRVKIGPYRHYYSTRRVEDTYFKLRYLTNPWEDHPEDAFDRLVVGVLDWWQKTVLRPINHLKYSYKFFDRVERVRVDDYDVWNLNDTLAIIIYPCLIKLKEIKRGSPHIDDEDVPEELRSNGELDEYHTDPKVHDKWEWVLDEMIWAFGRMVAHDDGKEYRHNPDQLEMITTPVEGKGYSSISFNHQKDPSREPYWVDEEGLAAHRARIDNGVRLFGKYYRSLWD